MLLALTNSPQFRYTLRSELLGSQRLQHEPVDWQSIGVTLARDRKSHGTTTEYSAQVRFVKAGGAYLRRAYQAAGIEADVRVGIEQLDPNAFAWQPYYRGRVNFTSAEFTQTEVKVNIEQQSFLQQFLARDSVKVDVLGSATVSGAASPAPTPVRVELHSRAVLQRYAASQKNAVATSAQMFGDEGNESHEQLLYFGFDTTDTNELGLEAVAGGFVAGSASSVVPIHRAKGPEQLTIELRIIAQVTATNNGNGPEFETVEGDAFLRVVRAGVTTEYPLVPAFYQGNLGGDYYMDLVTGTQSYAVDLQLGDAVYLYARYFVHEIGGAGTTIRYQSVLEATMQPGSYLRLTAVNQTAPTPTTGVLLYEAFERVAQALTEEVDVFRSDFFGRTDLGYPVDGPGALTLLTGGFQVRGFPLLTDPAPAAGATDARKSLFTTWAELYDSAAAAWCLGWGTEWAVGKSGQLRQVIRVEPWSYWYPDEVVVDLTSAGPVAATTKVSEADHYQVVEMGYRSWQAEQANGLDEYNSTRQYTTPLTVVSNTYAQISAISASGILLETTRRNRFDATASADTSQDATNFFVCLLRTGTTYVTERNQLATVLTGVLSPESVYNLRLSPARMLQRHGAQLRAGLVPTPGALVRFTAGTGNTGLVSQLSGETAPVAEGQALAVLDLPAPAWRAEGVSLLGVPLKRQQLQALLARPTGRVRYLSATAQAVREGWVLDFTHQAEHETGDFTLLPCLP